MGLFPQTQSMSDSLNDSADMQNSHGSEESQLINDFPQSQGDLNVFKQQIAEKW